MRKAVKILGVLFIGMLLNVLVAQTSVYKPFPESFAVWKVSCWGNINGSGPDYHSFQKYQVSGNMTVNSVSYKRVDCTVPVYGNPAQPLGPMSLCFGYRNDSINKKVYFLDFSGPTPVEHLWYDFNLVVADTLKNTYALTNPPWPNSSNQRKIVSSIDSVAFCGKYYKRFKFNCAGGFNTDLIEGVGFADLFTHTGFPDCPFEPLDIYTTVFSTCAPTAIQEFYDNKNALKLFPNPTSSSLKVNSDLPLSNYAIYNNLGALVASENVFENNVIDVSKISTGLYILKVEDEFGNSFYSKFIKE
jgi:hypothetical protein